MSSGRYDRTALMVVIAAVEPLAALAWMLVIDSRSAGPLAAVLIPSSLLFACGLGLFATADHPEKHLQIVDSGRTLGRDWVRIQGQAQWIAADHAARLRAQPSQTSVTPSHSGFSIVVPSGELGVPFEAAATLTTLLATGGWVFLLGLASVLAVGAGGLDLQSGLAVLAGFAFSLLLGHGAVFAVLWRLLQFVARLLAPARGQTVTVEGRQLRVGDHRFQLGHPQLELRVDHGAYGAILTLTDPDQRLQIHGRHTELLALQQALRAWMPPDGGTAEEIPNPLRQLRREGT